MTIEIGAEAPPLKVDADGVVRVGGTRVTLDSVVNAFESGATAEQIAQQFPSITLADAYRVIAFYLGHRKEVEAYLGNRREEAARARAESEAKFHQDGIRERLMARRKQDS